jgi:hypothetical protein
VATESGVDDRLFRTLVYHVSQGREVEVLLCSPATRDEPECTGSSNSSASPAVYAVWMWRRFANEAASQRFRTFASETLRGASQRTWIECDQPFYGLRGSATATVEQAVGHSVLITLTRTLPAS